MSTNDQVTMWGFDPTIPHIIGLCIAILVLAAAIYIFFRVARRLLRK